MEMGMAVLALIIGFGMLAKGADWFVEGASGIAERFKIPQAVIGLTIVAMGTSAPEAAVSITAAIKGNADITIGNIVGSNILNILIILGISSIIVPLAVAGNTVMCDIPLMIAVTVLLLIQGMGGTIGFGDGLILTLVFSGYLLYLFYTWKKSKTAGTVTVKSRKLRQSLAGTVTGLVMIILGSHLAVNGASCLARTFGMSERFIGLTIVALGTSLPELFTSVSAAMKRNAEIAIGNIVGSNIFNILFVVGISSLITPVPFSPEFYTDAVIAAAAGILLLLCCLRKRELRRRDGILMLTGYALYFISVCL
jgi:cation:H+ antiporter